MSERKLLCSASVSDKFKLKINLTEACYERKNNISAKITLVITYLFCVLLFLLEIFAVPILTWIYGENRNETIKIVICSLPAWVALISILKPLKNVISENIFSAKNISYLRNLSYCCGFVAVVCFVSGVEYLPMMIFSLGAGFMMLILRVLKNVIAKATEIKSENDLTV